MKYISSLSIIILLFNVSNAQVSYSPIVGDGYLGSNEFPATGVASDFGARCFGNDKWHSGVDFNVSQNDGDNDYGVLILAAGNGFVRNGLANSGNTMFRADLKYLFVGGFSYVHLFKNADPSIPPNGSYMVGNCILMKQDEPFDDYWCIVFKHNDVYKAIGAFPGMVTVNDALPIVVDDNLAIGDGIGPLGNSGNNIIAHLHLGSTNGSQIGNNLEHNPLEFVSYAQPTFNVYLKYKDNNDNVVDGYLPKYGNNSSPVKIIAQLNHEGPSESRYYEIFDIDEVSFFVTKLSENNFNLIRGAKHNTRINEGGHLSGTVFNHDIGSLGSWNRTGINPRAYSDPNDCSPHHSDEFYYSDIYWRISNTHSQGSKIKLANCPDNTEYEDGQYAVKGKVESIKGEIFEGSNTTFTLDNFQPYIQSVRVLIDGILVYQAGWVCTDNGPKFTKSSCFPTDVGPNSQITVNVTTSEEMVDLRGKIVEFGGNFIQFNNQGNNNWSYTFQNLNYLQEGDEGHLQFKGHDLNGNEILDMKACAGGVITDNIIAEIPIRESYASWNPDRNGTNIDDVHIFCFKKCENLKGGGQNSLIVINCINQSNVDAKFKSETSFGSHDGWIHLDINGGFPPYDIKWTDKNGNLIEEGLNDYDLNNLSPGTYCYKITDDQCCEVNSCINLCPEIQIVVTLEITNPSDCQTTNGVITVVSLPMATGGQAPYQFHLENIYGSWMEFDSNTGEYRNLSAGKYYYISTDANGCTGVYDIELDLPSDQDFTIEPMVTNSCNHNDGSILLNIYSLNHPDDRYDFMWSTGFEELNVTESTLDNLNPGRYCVIVTSRTTLCSKEDCFTVDDLSPSPITISETIHRCDYNQCNGSIEINILGGAIPFQVQWTGPGGNYPPVMSDGNNGSEDLMDLCQGTYCVTITEATCGNAKTACYEVEGCPFIDLSGSFIDKNNPSSCNAHDGSILPRDPDAEINGQECLTCVFHLEDAAGNSIQGDGFGYHDLESGKYYFIATDENGCTGSLLVEIIAEDGFYTTSTFINPCPGQHDGRIEIYSLSLNDQETFKYDWSTGFSQGGIPWGEPSILHDLPIGQYCVTITSEVTNCQLEECFDLTSNPIPFELNESITHPCPGYPNGKIRLYPIGGTPPYSYLWENNCTQGDRWYIGNGMYCVTVTDHCGESINECYQLEAMEVSFSSQILCYNQGEAQVTIEHGNTPYKIKWSTGSTSDHISNLGDGFYWVKVTDNNNCTFYRSFTLNYPRKIFLESIKYSSNCDNNNPTCDGEINLNSTDQRHYTFNWTGPNGFTSNSEDINNLCPGTYNVTATDDNGCIEPLSILICCCSANNSNYQACPNTNIEITYEKEIISPKNSGSNNGSIKLTVSGGNGKYYYNWTGPGGFTSKEKDLLQIGRGTYCVTITDGCHTKNECIELKSCDEKNIQINGQITNTCQGVNYGAIVISTTGTPVTPLTYHWSNGSSSKNLIDIAAGQYCITVTDHEECTTTNCFTVGYNSLVPFHHTIPCEKEWTCNGRHAYSDPYSLDCGYYDPNDCTKYICYCTLTNGVNSAYTHSYTSFSIQNECEVWGRCPNGQWQFYSNGSISTEFYGFDGWEWVCVYAKYCNFSYHGQSYRVFRGFFGQAPNDIIQFPVVLCGNSQCLHDVSCGETYVGSYCGSCPALQNNSNSIRNNKNEINIPLSDVYCQIYWNKVSNDSTIILVPNFAVPSLSTFEYDSKLKEFTSRNELVELTPLNRIFDFEKCGSKVNFEPLFGIKENRKLTKEVESSLEIVEINVNNFNELNIKFNSKTDQEIRIMLVNNLGQIVKFVPLKIRKNLFTYDLDLNDLISGIYYLSINDAKEKLIYSKKIVVVKD